MRPFSSTRDELRLICPTDPDRGGREYASCEDSVRPDPRHLQGLIVVSVHSSVPIFVPSLALSLTVANSLYTYRLWTRTFSVAIACESFLTFFSPRD